MDNFCAVDASHNKITIKDNDGKKCQGKVNWRGSVMCVHSALNQLVKDEFWHEIIYNSKYTTCTNDITNKCNEYKKNKKELKLSCQHVMLVQTFYHQVIIHL